MYKSNMIISIIIVIVIAACVAAYGLTSNNEIFTDLANLVSDSDGEEGTNDGEEGILGNTRGSAASNTNNVKSSGSDGGGSNKYKDIAKNAVLDPECTVVDAGSDSNYYYFNVVNKITGVHEDYISVNKNTKLVERG